MGAEMIIVYIHFGRQDSVAISEAEDSITQYLADCGVDLIIGSHPHVLQRFTYVKASDGRLVPVAFSLGNFCSSMAEMTVHTYNVILRVAISRKGDDIQIDGIDYTPCKILHDTQDGYYVVTPTSSREGLSDEQIDMLKTAEESIERSMGPEIKRNEF